MENKSDKFKAQTGAKLIIDNDNIKEREIIFFDYTFKQPTDNLNQPSGIPRGGVINLTVKALEDNADIFLWMISEESKKNGKIEVMVPGENKKMKTIEFEEAFCINYNERWFTKDTSAAYPHTESFTLTCRKITNSGANYTSEWK